MPKRLYLTTTLPYINAEPHIGFALELVQADIYARYRQLLGDEVFLNTGTDEHGVKIYRRAKEAGQEPQDFADKMAEKFKKLLPALDVLPEANFIRTTDARHIAAAQELWRRCERAGDIYKKTYKIRYCVGCELEKTESELADGRCLFHPDQALEIIEEENYFFRFSKYQDRLLELYEKRPDFVLPQVRLNEIKAFVARGLEDFSISRLEEKMPWGVEAPGDPDQVMYVWFDALVNYLAAIGWPDESYKEWWPVVQFAGKDNLRQQSAMWQAMLMSVGIEPSRQVVIHGFITLGGQKMSKSLGNVIDPFTLVDEYGTDAVRYYLARHVHPFEDSDVTPEKFKEAYNADLANGLGNLVSRVMQLAQVHLSVDTEKRRTELFPEEYKEKLGKFEFNHVLQDVFERVKALDRKITRTEPFKLIKTNPREGTELILDLILGLYVIGYMLGPFMPETSKKIIEAVETHKKPEMLFPRKE